MGSCDPSVRIIVLINTQADEQTVSGAVLSKLTWRLVPFLFVLYMIAYLDRINVGFAALQMREQLHFGDRVYGLGAGIFFTGYFIFQLPSNLTLQRIGARRWISILMITWGVISSSTMFVSTPREFYMLRFLLGAAEAGFFPGLVVYVKNWFPNEIRARTVARFMAAGPLAGVFGGPVSGLLLNLNGQQRLAGWQWLFLLEGVPAFLMGIVVFVYLTDKPSDADWLTAIQREWLANTLNHERVYSVRTMSNSPLALLTSGVVWLLAFVVFGASTCTYGMVLWLPTLIHSRSSVGNLMIGVLTAIPLVAASIGMTLVSLHSDRSGERRWHVTTCALAGAIALVALTYSTSLVGIVIGISFAAVSTYSIFGPFWAMATTLLEGSVAAAGIALINSVGNLGGFFGPYIIGFVRDATGTFRGGFFVAAATLAICGLIVPLVSVKAGSIGAST